MLLLARWQLHRADEKIALQEAADTARQTEAVQLDTQNADKLDSLASNYGRVSLTGRWRAGQQFLWDNRIHKGLAGFEVITPLSLSDGRLVLVNRGWIEPGTSRSDLPDVTFAEPEAQASDVTGLEINLVGLFSRPSRGFAQGPPYEESEKWPRILQYFEYDLISQALGSQVLPGVVQVLDASLDEQSVTDSTTWLTPNWQPAASGPAKHYSYAFQWFVKRQSETDSNGNSQDE